MNSDPRSMREFAKVVRDELSDLGSDLPASEVDGWLRLTFSGVKFGDPDYLWTHSAARDLARDLEREASTW